MKKSEKELVSTSLIHRLSPLSLRAKTVVEGFLTGMHKSPFHGFSVEFAEHRMYQPGDPLKHVDWKVYGRSDRYYIKQYQEETNLKAMILLDQSQSMKFKSGGVVSKFEYGRSLAAALIYLLLMQRDAVGLSLFDNKIEEFYHARSALSWRNVLWTALENASEKGKTGIGNVLHELAEKLNRRGMVILISDLLDNPDDIISGLHHFRHNGHEVLVFQVLDPRELDFNFSRESRFEELETGSRLAVNPWQVREAYRSEMSIFLQTLRKGCFDHRVHHHLLNTNTELDEALIAFLTLRQRQN